MPDRYSYSSPWAGGSQPWFRVGQLDVTTTVAVIGVGVFSMLIWAIEGAERTISRQLYLTPQELPGVGSVLEGQVWRLVTWPVPNEPDFWTIILFAIFYMLGSQLENLLGRNQFLWFLIALTLIPALVVTVFDLLFTGFIGIGAGLRFVELGVLLAFVAQFPTARFWPGIPAWILGAVVVGLEFLQALGDRNDFNLVLLFTTVAVSLIGIRSFGHAEELPWVPRINLPSFVTGEGRPSRPSSSGSGGGRSRGRRRRGRSNLTAVPTSGPADASEDIEIDALLDQVAERGLDSLTKDQRKRLEEHSKRLRKKRDG